MIRENKHVRHAVEDDSEVSTTAGCSDHSDDEPPPSPTCSMVGSDLDMATAPLADGLTQKELMAEIARNFQAVYVFLSVLLLTVSRMQPPVQAILTPFQPSPQPATPQPATRKASGSKASKPKVNAFQGLLPPPGLGLCSPPGIFEPRQPADTQLFQKIGPPPGLEAFGPISFPPGLGPNSQPVGRKQPKAARTGKAKRAEKDGQKQAVHQATVVPQAPPPPPLPATPLPPLERREFDQVVYRKELSDVMRDLANGTNVAACVRRIRAQSVPEARQAEEFSDILTRAAEENRGSARRLAFAFAVGLAAGESNSAFAHEECEKGLELFFGDVFDELASEVPRLRSKIANELAPTLRTAFTAEQLSRLVPPDCRSVTC